MAKFKVVEDVVIKGVKHEAGTTVDLDKATEDGLSTDQASKVKEVK